MEPTDDEKFKAAWVILGSMTPVFAVAAYFLFSSGLWESLGIGALTALFVSGAAVSAWERWSGIRRWFY